MDSREYARTVWNSRRGMHEIDVMLDPFVKEDLLGLDEKRQREYVRLLDRTDLELINFLVRGADAEDDARYRGRYPRVPPQTDEKGGKGRAPRRAVTGIAWRCGSENLCSRGRICRTVTLSHALGQQ